VILISTGSKPTPSGGDWFDNIHTFDSDTFCRWIGFRKSLAVIAAG